MCSLYHVYVSLLALSLDGCECIYIKNMRFSNVRIVSLLVNKHIIYNKHRFLKTERWFIAEKSSLVMVIYKANRIMEQVVTRISNPNRFLWNHLYRENCLNSRFLWINKLMVLESAGLVPIRLQSKPHLSLMWI